MTLTLIRLLLFTPFPLFALFKLLLYITFCLWVIDKLSVLLLLLLLLKLLLLLILVELNTGIFDGLVRCDGVDVDVDVFRTGTGISEA